MKKNRYKEKLKVLHVTSELTPIAKAGGLGDVVGFLPKELAREFHIEIRIIMPKYKCIDTKIYPIQLIMKDIKILMPDCQRYHKVSIWKTFLPETIVPIYLVDAPQFFPGDGIYSHKIPGRNANFSFFFLSKVVLELLRAFDWQPDVIHCHDGMMAMIPKWLKTAYKDRLSYKKIASVLTIHNLNFQPILKLSEVGQIGLKRRDFKEMRKFLRKDDINVMAEAINNADVFNTVSPTYAKEILTKKYGVGLHRLLKRNKYKFTGILNGMDYHNFDPRTNPDTPVKYWIDNLDKKVENKLFLQKKFGLTQSADLPLICAVTRLSTQKGLDLIEDVMKDLVDMGAQFIILGSGSEKIEKIFIKAEKKYPESVEAEMEFDANLAQTIYAGADMLLMPSRFEPCGLSQIIAMRFGTIPIVRHTGGLADTVRDGYTGFVFRHYDKNAFLWAIRRAVDIYYNQKDYWRKMQINCMEKDFSWKTSAKKYIWLYKKAIQKHKEYLKENETRQNSNKES